MHTSQLIETINTELQEQADPSYRELVRTRYNMRVDRFWGVRTPTIRRIAGRHYKEIKGLSLDQRLEVCQHLLTTGIYEHKIIAFRWAHLGRRDYAEEHLEVFADWLDTYVDDWIDCDDLCTHVIGEFFLKYPERADEALRWAGSANEWTRRGAAVSLILPARKGQQLALVFDVAELLLQDDKAIVRKGYGWLLKETSKAYPQEVFDYVMSRREAMPRESLRSAIEKLPEQLRRQAMEKSW